ncbi:MAG: PAS domain S-box protein, partial [Candidatus Omnitrophica bacterium]|nr:PAS domain S-box protein [Candidatus Omnitrophota bacterium]
MNEKKDLYDSITKHFSNLFKDSKVGIVITDSEGRFCHVNDAFCRLLKYSENDLKNLTVKDVTHPEDHDGVSMFFADGSSPQVSPVFHAEKRYLTKDGKSVWARVTATWMFDNNKPVYAAAMIENIGSLRTEQERKRREEKQIFELQTAIVTIARNSSVVRGAFSTATKFITEKTSRAINVERVGIWLFSPDRKELRCVDLYQHSRKEHSEGMVLKAEDYPIYFKALETGRAIDASDALSDTRTEEFVEGYLKPYGIVSMLDAAIRVSGEIVGVVCCEHVSTTARKWFGAEVHFAAEVADQMAHVILSSERNKAIEELKESEERFRMMADSAPVMIWVSGEDALCNFFNKQWLDFVGRTLEQELGKGWIQGVHEKDLELCIEKYLKAFKAREEFEVQYRLKRKDGIFRWVLSKGIPRYTPEGSFQGYIGTCIDITDSKEKQRLEQEKVQEKLEQSEEYNRMLFELAPMGLALCTMEGKLVDLNPAYAKIIGRTVDETLGLTYWEITP